MRYLDLLRALTAAQVALWEHFDESVNESNAKAALIKCLTAALKQAKKLD